MPSSDPLVDCGWQCGKLPKAFELWLDQKMVEMVIFLAKLASMVVFLSIKFGGTQNNRTLHESMLWHLLLMGLLLLLLSSAMVTKYFCCWWWLLADKSKVIPENTINFLRTSYKIFSYQYLFLELFIFNINSKVFLSHSPINKQNQTNIKAILLSFIPINWDKSKSVLYLMI